MTSLLVHLIIASCLLSVDSCHSQAWAQRVSDPITRKRSPETQRVARTHFNAHQVRWDHHNFTLSAIGEVKLVQGFLKLSCARATLTFTPKPVSAEVVENDTDALEEIGAPNAFADARLNKVVAEGGVTVTFRDLKITAAQVTYDHPSRVLTAQGVIRGTWRAMSLQGTSLEISLLKQHASIRKASVSLPLPRIVPSTPSEARVRSWAKR